MPEVGIIRTTSNIKQPQAAEFLQVSFWTLLLWRKQAKGPPYIKVGHFIRYAKGDLIDWLQSNKICPTMQGRRASVIYE
jgi:predicted DNA-binding transcriptional regulator AlpA